MAPIWQLLLAGVGGGGVGQLVVAIIGRHKVHADAAEVIQRAASGLVTDYVRHHAELETRMTAAERKATLAVADAQTAREEAATARAGEARCHARLERAEARIHALEQFQSASSQEIPS